MMKKNHPYSKRVLALFLSVWMLCMQLPMGVFAVDAAVGEVETPTEVVAGALSLGSSVFVEEKTLFSFTPEKSGVYCFYSTSDDSDPKARLLDSDKNALAADDDGGENMNFELNYELSAGTTYYLEADAYEGNFPYTLSVKESDIASIEIVSIPEFEVIEGDMTYGYFSDEWQGEFVDRYFVYRFHEVLYDAVLRVNYQDGTSKEMPYFDDATGERSGFNAEWDFYHHPWTVGDNHFYVTYKGMRTLANATVIESPVEKIELPFAYTPEFIENDEFAGYWIKEYNGEELEEPFFYYHVENFADSVLLKVTYKDGTTKEITNFDEMGGYNGGITVYSDQLQNPWTLGENEFEIWYQGAHITQTANVVKSQVESIRIISGGSFEYVEFDTSCGYWEFEDFFYYEPHHFMQDIVLEVTYKDGTTKELVYANTPGIVCRDNQYNNPWTVGGENQLTISYQGVKTVANVTIKPSIVESITVDDVTVTEGTNGSFWGYNTENGNDSWYHYEIFAENVTVKLTDGTTFSGTPDELQEEFGAILTISPELYQNYHNQWGVGEHEIIASFMGKKTQFKFIIVESDVASVSVEDLELREGEDGHWETGYWQNGEWIEGEWFSYSIHGLVQITLRFQDGSVFTGTINEISKTYGIEPHITYDQSYNNQWKPGETHSIKVIICGKRAEFNATVIESEVESIEVIDTKGFSYYENDPNCGEFHGDYFYYNAWNLASKVTVLVTYKDGSTEEVPYYDPQTGEYSGMSFFEDQERTHWTVGGENKLIITYRGAKTTISATIQNSPIASVTAENVTKVLYSGGYWDNGGYWNENDIWIPANRYYYYHYQSPKVTVTYNDGKVISGTLDEIEKQTGSRPTFSAVQNYENQWGLGNYTATVSFLGVSSEYTVSIVESNVASISVPDKTVIEGTGGWWNREADLNYYYYYETQPDTITVNYKDGTSLTGSFGEIEEITGYCPEIVVDQNFESAWGVGTHTVKVSYYGAITTFNFNVTSSPVASITAEPITLTYLTGGNWNGYHDEEGYKEYYRYHCVPEKVTVIYKDGNTFTGTPDELFNQTGYSVAAYTDQSPMHKWGIGAHTATVAFMGKTCELGVTIEESNIQSITVSDVTYTEGTGGWWNQHYDSEGVLRRYYYYEVYPEEITVNYKDGSSLTGTFDQIELQTGSRPGISSDQGEENPWGVGTHKVEVSYAGITAEYNVVIEASNVASVTAKPLTYVENTGGGWNTHYDEFGNEHQYYSYSTTPSEITVTYTDGTTISGTPDYIERETGYRVYYFNDQNYDNQWGVGTHAVMISFLGRTGEMSVTVEASPLESITVETVYIEEGTNGYWSEHDEYGYQYFYNLRPEKITIRYTDGTEISGSFYELQERLENQIYYDVDQPWGEPWGVGTHTASVTYLGTTVEFDIVITPTQIADIKIMPIIHVAGEDGWTNRDYYDQELGSWVDGEWYEYTAQPQMMMVTFKDGTVFAGRYGDFVDLGYDVEFDNDQSYFNPLGVGVHETTLMVGAFSISYTVEIVEKIEKEAFSYGILSDGTAVLLKYHNESPTVILPDTVDGYTVSVIGKSVLAHTDVQSLTIPATVKRIDHDAFEWSQYLETVKLYAGLEVIGTDAFEGCDSLSEVIFYGTSEEAESIVIYGRNDLLQNANWKYTAECTDHEYDDVCDADCNICFASREPEHAYVWVIDYEGNCVENGYKHEQCTLCYAERNHDTVIPAKGEHENTEWINKTEATCGKNGYTGDLYCYDCETYLENGETIPATGNHAALSIINAKVATCNEEGYTGDVFCKNCKTITSYGETIPATGEHVYDNAYDTSCNVCGEEREGTTAPAVLSLNSCTAFQGETIRVDVSIKGNTGFAGLQFGILYDNTYLTLKNVETRMEDFFVTVGNSIVFDSIQNHTSDGVIATLVFEVAEDARVGDYGVQLRFMSASTDDFNAVVMTDCSATISVESAQAGDANGDGFVDTIDLVMIRKYLAAMDPVTKVSEIEVRKGADANNDGVIDAIDLAFVRQYLASMSAF